MTDGRGDPLYDLMVRTSYNKRVALDVPIFEDKQRANRVRWGETVVDAVPSRADAGAPVAGSLARLFSAQAWYEPANDTPRHRAYPSPRGLFPVDIDLVASGAQGEARISYEPEHDAWVREAGAAMAGDGGVSLRFDLVAALDRIAPLYGELAPTLCALEAGHIAQKLCEALADQGVEFRASCTGGGDDAFGTGHDSRVSLVRVEVDACWPLRANNETLASIRIARPLLNDEDRHRVLRARSAMVCAAGEPLELNGAGSAPAGAETPRAGSARRSSGVFLSGMYGAKAAPEARDALMHAIAGDHRALFEQAQIKPSLTMLATRPDRSVSILRADTGAGDHVADGWTPLAEAFGTAHNVDLETVCLFALFSAPFARLLRGQSSWRYMQMLVSAGMAAQGIADRAAGCGFFARPFRGMVEEQLETAFEIDGQVFYGILLGKPRASNPAFSIGALDLPAREG